MSIFKNANDYRNTYLAYLPMELIALLIPKYGSANFLSLFNNPKQLFKICFKYNYPNYFNILEIDNETKINDRKGIFTKLFNYFKNNKDDKKEIAYQGVYLIYPIELLDEFPGAYKIITKYKYIKNIFYFSYDYMTTIVNRGVYFSFFNLDVNMKLELIKSISNKFNRVYIGYDKQIELIIKEYLIEKNVLRYLNDGDFW